MTLYAAAYCSPCWSEPRRLTRQQLACKDGLPCVLENPWETEIAALGGEGRVMVGWCGCLFLGAVAFLTRAEMGRPPDRHLADTDSGDRVKNISA